MSAFLAILSFELRTRLRLVSTWVYFTVFFSLAALWTLAAGGAFSGIAVSFGSDKVWVNAPMALMTMVGLLSVLALPVISAVMGRAVQQDFETQTHHAFFTSPISKAAYLGGRFAAAVVLLLLVLSSLALGARFAVALPAIDPSRSGEVGLGPYVWPYLVMVLPNLIFLGAIFFTLGALTRRMLPVYLTSAVLLVGYLVASELNQDLDNRLFSSLADPFGITATLNVTEYWSVAERNTRVVPLAGHLLLCRALWLGVSALVLAAGYRRFRFTAGGERAGKAPAAAAAADPLAGALAGGGPEPGQAASAPWKRAVVRPPDARTLLVSLLVPLVWLQLKETVKNVYFGVIVLTGLLFVIAGSTNLGAIFGTNTYPVTYQVLDLVSGQFGIFVLILITYYSGELVWRERDHRVDQLHDALPVPTWLPLAAKLLALMMVPVLLQGVVMLAGIGLQLAQGYTHLEPGLYLRHLFTIQLLNYWGLCALALTVHALVNHKMLGHFAMVLYFIATTFSSWLGVEHRLLRPFQVGTPRYSDMNGYGDALGRIRWLQTTWVMLAILLLVLARLFWPRGTVVGLRSRLAVARSRLAAPVLAVAALALAGFAGSAAFVLHNTNGLNRYRPASEQRALQAAYERTYRSRLMATPQARLTAVNVQVDLYPGERRARAAGTFVLTNKGPAPVTEVWINLPGNEATLELTRLEIDRPATLLLDDRPQELRAYQLAAPLLPGERVTLSVELTWGVRGFANEETFFAVVGNGSFVNNRQLLPSFGYLEGRELATDGDRKRFGLPIKDRMLERTDPEGLAASYISPDADWITFETVVSTTPDQLAVAPGYLQREWSEGGRRYFHYKMDSPILNFYAFLSARYQVKRDRWNGVALEVYYHPGHEYNLDRMLAASRDSLEYFTRAFGPYQHRQFRILEFPRYARFAQAFPNTIPYSESIGFIAKVDESDEEDLDYPYYVTAHELAHQWWAHQVIGANVQGATMLSETLAQYSALMVMKRRYGEARMKRFLRYELDRYLLGRATENKREVPLARVENQPYIHYAKGSLAMYALQDALGEDAVNRAIKAFRDATAYQGPPYPTSLALVEALRQAAPPEQRELVEDLFERIVLFENRALAASAKKLPDGRYEVSLRVRARKVRASELGAETEVPVDDLIDLGVMGEGGEGVAPLYLSKHRLKSGDNEVKVIVSGEPATAGIDPLNKLIDRVPGDNVVRVER